VSPQEATQLLGLSLKHSAHRFWEATISYTHAVEEFGNRLVGHRQVTDAYLLGLAMHYGGKLATLDNRIQALLPPGHHSHSFIEYLGE
jgi:predicted nucleic acid-binding protein